MEARRNANATQTPMRRDAAPTRTHHRASGAGAHHDAPAVPRTRRRAPRADARGALEAVLRDLARRR
jgi:hypothetical protein